MSTLTFIKKIEKILWDISNLMQNCLFPDGYCLFYEIGYEIFTLDVMFLRQSIVTPQSTAFRLVNARLTASDFSALLCLAYTICIILNI